MSKELYKKLEMYENARRILKVHGLTSEAENRKIKGRIKKFCDRNDMPVENVSIFKAKERKQDD